MPTLITTELVRSLPLRNADLRDTKVQGFMVRCRASGHHSYVVALGRGRVVTIGRVGILTPAEARERARQRLAEDARGDDPIAAKKAARKKARAAIPFTTYLDDHYGPWKVEHHKRGKETVQRLRSVFADFDAVPLSELTAWRFEKWRTGRLKTGTRPDTANSHLRMLKAALAKAVAWKLLPDHPLAAVTPVTADRTGRVRYLTPDEEKRLRKALAKRDARRRATRARSNRWRRERGYALWPSDAPDHLTPIVLLAVNTGLRKGEIFALRWTDVDLMRAQLVVRGDGAKSGQTRHVPLNAEVLAVLRKWRPTDRTGYVFHGRTAGEPLDDVKKAWLPVVKAAKLRDFTFHDLRHTFASKLVMRGVDLNTVRELLGHADLKMTLRYAHLAPAHNAEAVAKLVG